jgi:hypothetical protein
VTLYPTLRDQGHNFSRNWFCPINQLHEGISVKMIGGRNRQDWKKTEDPEMYVILTSVSTTCSFTGGCRNVGSFASVGTTV